MRILIFGGHGFIGSNIIELFKNKHFFHSIDNKKISKGQKNYTFADLSKSNVNIKIRGKFDIAFILSADIFFKKKNEIEFLKNNMNILLNCLSICKKNNIKKLIYASSAAVYGNSKVGSSEQQNLKPINIYGHYKKLSEEIIINLSKQNNYKFLIFRLFNVYGDHKQNLLFNFKKKKRKKQIIKINGNGNQLRDFIHVKDVASAFMSYPNCKKWNSIVNISTNKSYSLNKIIKILKCKFRYVKLGIEPMKILGSNLIAKKILNWYPKNHLKDWLRN